MRTEEAVKAATEIIAVLLAVKIFSFLLATLSWAVFKGQPADIIFLWNRWDAPHYVEIAKNGYTAVGEARYFIVFMPLFPFLIKVVAVFVRNYEVAALLISNSASVLAALYLYRLARLDYPHGTALKSVFYFCIFPTSYFLIAGYTESLFLLLTIACFYYARRGKWFSAGVLGMLASATRITGLVLIPALFFELFSQTQNAETQNAETKTRKSVLHALSVCCLIGLGFVSYLVLNYAVFGDAFAFLAVQQEHWSKHLAPPWEGLLGALSSVFWRDAAGKVLVGGAELVFGLLGLACILYAVAARLRPSYTIYTLLTWLVVTSTSFWLSVPRYTLSLFPIFILLAVLGEKREELHYAMTVGFLLFFGFFLVLFTQGQWAF